MTLQDCSPWKCIGSGHATCCEPPVMPSLLPCSFVQVLCCWIRAGMTRSNVCNHSDDSGRYSYEAQPGACRWNCEKLADALAPVLTPSRTRNELAMFDQEYDRHCSPCCALAPSLHAFETCRLCGMPCIIITSRKNACNCSPSTAGRLLAGNICLVTSSP